MKDTLISALKALPPKIAQLAKELYHQTKYLIALGIFKAASILGNKDTKNKTAQHKKKYVSKSVPAKAVKAKIITTAKQKWPAVDGDKSIYTPANNSNSVPLSVLASVSKMFIILIIFAMAAGVGIVFGIAKAYSETTPTLDTAKIQNQAQTSYIYDSSGALITEYRGTENRVLATTEEIPNNLKKAFVAIEDVRFYQHNGVDLKRIIGAFVSNLSSNSVSGGSTITQQLIKQKILTSERSYKRKIQEAFLAMQLETQYSKDEILVSYLNTIALGGSNYGVKAAALDYFGKDLKDLTLRECACLAGLTQNPYAYNPRRTYYVTKQPQITNNRTNTVLTSMYNNNMITKEEYEQAMSEQLVVKEKSTNSAASIYPMPHFIEYAINDVITYLLKSRNQDPNDSSLRSAVETEIRTKGYRIYTTVDTKIQNDLQDTVASWTKWPSVASGSSVTKQYNSDGTYTELKQPQAAAVIIDYHTGEIKALIGSRDVPTTKKTFNRAYQGTMSVGSSIKPLAVYGPAIDQGASAASTVLNVPSTITGWVSSKGYPDNYEGSGFNGVVTLRQAIVKSLNVPAARTLLQLSSVSASTQYLQNLGVDLSDIQQTPAGLALGTSPITPVEMAAAFGAIGNGGLYIQPLSFTKVTDAQGNVLLDASQLHTQNQAFKASTAYILLDLLTNAVQSGTGTGAQISGITVAGKTGTVQDYKGVYFTGITPYYSASVWMGTDDYKIGLRSGSTGGTYAAPLFRAFMTKALAGKSNKAIMNANPESLGLVKVTTCSVTGKLATEACVADTEHPTVTEWWANGTQPTEKCDLHVLLNVCADTNKIATDNCPNVVKKSFILYKSSSILSDAPLSIIQQYIPNVITEIQLTDYCTAHTSEWKSTYATTVADANTAIANANTFINTYKTQITSAQQTSITNDIANVQTLLSASPIDYAALKQSTQSLNNTVAAVKATLHSTPSP